MSTDYIKKVNDIPLAASEAVPSSEIDVKLKDLKNRWNDNHGNMQTISNTSAVWAKLATVTYPSGLDGENAIYGKIMLHQYATTKLAADFSFLFPSGALAICKGNFTSNNIGNIKIGFVVDSTNRTVDLYGYISGYAYSGIRLYIEDVVRYHGTTVDAAVQYYKNATLLSSEPSGIVYCDNDNGAVQTNVADYLKYQYTNEINPKNVPTAAVYGDSSRRHWLNYRNGDTLQLDATNPLTEYYFANRNGSVKGVGLHAEQLAFRTIGRDNSSNNVFFAKITMKDYGRGYIRFQLTAINPESGGRDVMGTCDILVKLRGSDDDWHMFYTRSVRSTESGSVSPVSLLQPIYSTTGSVPNKIIYIGVHKNSYSSGVTVEVIDTATDSDSKCLSDDSFYKGYSLEIGDFTSSVSSFSECTYGGTLVYNPNVSSSVGSSTQPVYADATGKLIAGSTMLKQDGSNATANSDGSGTVATMFGGLPTSWTAAPNDDTYFIRQDTAGALKFGRVKFSTIYQGIKNKVFYDRLYNIIQLGRGSGTWGGSAGPTDFGVTIPSGWEASVPTGAGINANLIIWCDGTGLSTSKTIECMIRCSSPHPDQGMVTVSSHIIQVLPGFNDYITIPFSGIVAHAMSPGTILAFRCDNVGTSGVKFHAYSYDVQMIY